MLGALFAMVSRSLPVGYLQVGPEAIPSFPNFQEGSLMCLSKSGLVQHPVFDYYHLGN
jgi:hypothetical protein